MAERNIPWSKWTYVDRDTCGNPVYISEMGQSYDSRGDSSYYKMEQTSKSIVTDYDNTYSISPQQIELLRIPIFTTTANTYEYGKIMGVTDKTGFTTNIRYDTLGRIKKAWSDLQSESDPAAEYTYYTPAGGSRWKVYEKVKSGNGYMESYHIYDGLGRWIQTQTLDVDGGIIVTGTKYNQNGGKAYDYKPTKFMSAFGTYIDLEAQGVEKNQYFYDSLDRPIWVFGYDVDDWLQAWQTTGNYVDTQYYISDTSDSITASYTEVYDQNNPKSGGSYIDPNPYIAYQDSRGQLIKVKEPLK